MSPHEVVAKAASGVSAEASDVVIFGLEQLPEIDEYAHLAKDAFFAIHRDRTIGIYMAGMDCFLRFPSKQIDAVVMALRDAELASAKLEGRKPSEFVGLLASPQKINGICPVGVKGLDVDAQVHAGSGVSQDLCAMRLQVSDQNIAKCNHAIFNVENSVAAIGGNRSALMFVDEANDALHADSRLNC